MEFNIKKIILLVIFIIANLGLFAQQPFYGTRKFISSDGNDTIIIEGSSITNGDTLKIVQIWSDTINGKSSDTLYIKDYVNVSKSVTFDVNPEAQETTKSINFHDGAFQKYDVSGTTTINISGYPDYGAGVYTLVIDNTNGSTVNIGTGWGTAVDNTGTISTTSGSKSFIQFFYDSEDLTYMIITRDN